MTPINQGKCSMKKKKNNNNNKQERGNEDQLHQGKGKYLNNLQRKASYWARIDQKSSQSIYKNEQVIDPRQLSPLHSIVWA